jgi:hypothetical protein
MEVCAGMISMAGKGTNDFMYGKDGGLDQPDDFDEIFRRLSWCFRFDELGIVAIKVFRVPRFGNKRGGELLREGESS